MNRTSFLNLVQNPHLLDESTVDALSSIVSDYPYFQAARMLLVKNLAVVDSLKYSSVLKTSAAYITHREKLYQLVYSLPLFSESDITQVVPESPVETESSVVEEPSNEEVLSSTIDLNKIDYFEVSDTIELSSFSFSAPVVPDSTQTVSTVVDFANDAMDNSNELLDFENQMNSVYLLDDEISVVEREELSFSDWLNKVSVQKAAKLKEEKPKDEKMALINNFLKAKPKIVPRMVDVPQEDTAVKKIYDEPENLLTETLANIYIKQKHYDKAINIFEKLRLKYPEKSVYFANRISEIEK